MPNVLGGGDVAGPASATDNAVARFDGTTGKLIQNSTVTIDDTGNITPSGSVHGANGSAANPSFAFLSDQDTGLYRIGANNIGVAANGAKVLDIATTGLTVTGAVTATTTLADQGGTIAAQRNGLAPAQGLAFDETTGATINATIGNGDFSVFVDVNPAAISEYKWIFHGAANAFGLFINPGSYSIQSSLVGIGDNTVSTGALTVGITSRIGYVKSGSTATYYINGVAAGTTTDSRNYSVATTSLGGTSHFFKGILRPIGILNRALSAAEVLALYQSGAVASGDYPKQIAGTALITGNSSTFASGVGSWVVQGAASIANTTNKMSVTGVASATDGTKISVFAANSPNKYRLTVTISNLVGGTTIGVLDAGANQVGSLVNGVNTLEFTNANTGGSNLFLVRGSSGAVTSFDVAAVTFTPLGALLAPDSAQVGGGLAWYDTSGNAANITLPATGVSWSLPTSGKAFSLSLASTTAGSSGAGALVVAGGLATGAASYFGGAVTVGGVISSTGKTTVTNGNIRLSNAFYLSGNLAAGTEITMIGRRSDDKIAIDPDGYGVVFGGGAATFAGAVAIGNTTAVSVAAPSTHKVSILIGGVQYYLLASNV